MFITRRAFTAFSCASLVIPFRPASANDQDISRTKLRALSLGNLFDLGGGNGRPFRGRMINSLASGPGVVVDQHTTTDYPASLAPVSGFCQLVVATNLGKLTVYRVVMAVGIFNSLVCQVVVV